MFEHQHGHTDLHAGDGVHERGWGGVHERGWVVERVSIRECGDEQRVEFGSGCPTKGHFGLRRRNDLGG